MAAVLTRLVIVGAGVAAASAVVRRIRPAPDDPWVDVSDPYSSPAALERAPETSELEVVADAEATPVEAVDEEGRPAVEPGPVGPDDLEPTEVTLSSLPSPEVSTVGDVVAPTPAEAATLEAQERSHPPSSP